MRTTSFLLLTLSVHNCLSSISGGVEARKGVATGTKLNKPPPTAKKIKAKPTTTRSTEDKDKLPPGVWPCFDALDKRLITISIPMIINFSITPLVGANDLFWTNRMNNALAVAGQAAATQVFNSGFWLASFLPSVTSTLVSRENAKGNTEGVQDAVCQALFVAVLIAAVGTCVYAMYPEKTLGTVLVEADAPAMEFARLYLSIRSFSFLPALISLVGFSAFRGTLDVKTPFVISTVSSLINCLLDPLLIFTFKLGIKGNAMSTLFSEVISAISFLLLLVKRDLIKVSKIFKLPAWSKLAPLIKGGFAMQLRLIAFNITFIAVARVTQSIDKTGVAAAAHELALQTFQLGGVVLLALSVVAQIMIPNELFSSGGPKAAKAISNRMMSWGLILGTLLGGLQVLVLPLIVRATPMQDVRDAAHAPAILASLLQAINGLVFIGEGVMCGCGDFMQVAISTIIATVGCLASLNVFPQKYGVTGVWMGFAVFNLLRLTGVAIHQFYTGAISTRNMKKAES